MSIEPHETDNLLPYGTPSDRSQPAVTVNGTAVSLIGLSPHANMLDWLRDRGLTGTKEGCAEGECGACSILVARPEHNSGSQWTAVNACLVPAAALDGQEVVTSEGIGSPKKLHPVQEEMAKRGGSQCGYCTPGFICSMAAEFYRKDRRPVESAETGCGDHELGPNGFDLHALSGNLCRCTGYRPIRDAAYALGASEPGDDLAERLSRPAPRAIPTRHSVGDATYARAADLADAFNLMSRHRDAKLVAGSTDWGVEVNIRGSRAPFVIGIDRVLELRGFVFEDSHIELGAALTLSEAEKMLAGRVPLLGELFSLFASRLIRNSATLGGNLGTGSPIGDTPPALLALEASVVLASPTGHREIPLEEYFTGYRQTVRRADEIIQALRFPRPLAPISGFHKIAKRRFDDISSVAVGYAFVVKNGIIAKARIGLGGVAATPLRAYSTERALEGRPWTQETVESASSVMAKEGTPMDDHRASSAYRSAMLGTSLLKFYSEHSQTNEGIEETQK